ncbi:hypothetical protein [Peribacillus sp. SCS-155]|uniref:hypothetical protein n=1 Tax=Peribacillus sedimenti TaxID=3115297 RepID=UPI003906C87F
MVNVDKTKFNKIQQEHKSEYIGTREQYPRRGKNDPGYNNQMNTDKHPGATGRDFPSENEF